MNYFQLTTKLANQRRDTVYHGHLTSYSVQSIECGRSSYSVSKLIDYCEGCGLQMVLTDRTFEESYDIDSIYDVHLVLSELMERYNVDTSTIYRKKGVHYSVPKDIKAVEDARKNGKKINMPLSIITLLEVCNVLKCKIDFVRKND